MTVPSFPFAPGGTQIAFPVDWTPTWRTIKQEAVSGKETRLQLWTFPKYKWEFPISRLRFNGSADYQTLVGFYNSLGGNALPFSFDWPFDDSIVTQQLGIGDGSTTTFNFIRAFGNFVEPTQNVTQASVHVFLNGTPTAAYTFVTDPNFGMTYALNFTVAPTLGVAITATFSYKWPCRFDDETLGFSNFLYNLFEAKKVTFTSQKII